MDLLLLLAVLALPLYWKRPAAGLLLQVFLQAVIFGGSRDVSLSKVLYAGYFAVLMLIWMPGFFATLRQTIRVPFAKWLAAMFTLFVVSRVVGISHGLAAVDWFREVSPLLNYGFAFLGIFAFSREPDLRRYLRWFLLVMFLLSVPAAATWMWFRGFLSESNAVMSLTNASPSVFMGGLFLAITLAAEDRQNLKLYTAAGAFFVGCMLITGSRMESASAILGAAIVAFLFWRRGELAASVAFKFATAAALIAVVAIVALSMSGSIDMGDIADRFLAATQSDIVEDQTVTNRITETLDAWEAFQEGPLVGKGLGYQTGTTYIVGHVPVVIEMYFIHNMYVYLLAKLGAVGFVVVLGYFASAIRTALRSFFRFRDRPFSGYFAAFVGFTVAILFESVTANQFADRTASSLIGVFSGLLLYLVSGYQNTSDPASTEANRSNQLSETA
ncbi:MAG: O-antigen ligase family protein [Candidatus Korobacteraceae bacterium]